MALHTVYTRDQAMAYAMAEIKSEMVGSNRDMEENFGMPTYLFEDGSYIVDGTDHESSFLYVCCRDGLDVRREFTIDIKPDGDIDTYAAAQARILYVRTYVNGCSHDTPIFTVMQQDRLMVQTLISGAISAYVHGYAALQDAANTAEFQATKYFKDRDININFYDTVYSPIKLSPFNK